MMKNCNNKLVNLASIIVLIPLLSCATGYNKHADQYFEEGLLFFERMEYERSIESFDKVLELAPYGKDNNVVYYNRGMAYLKNRQYDNAIYDFTKALELTPVSDKQLKFDILVFRGNAYQKSKAFDDAIKDYSNAIELIPTHENLKHVYSSRAWVWFSKGNHANAINDFSQAIKIDPEADAAYYGRASVWLKEMDFQRALADAKEAVKLKPNHKEYEDLLFKIKSSLNEQ
jgi:tetratricopeptide (TPR) repeat protein